MRKNDLPSDIERLKHIADAARAIMSFMNGKNESDFFKDEMLKAAVIQKYTVIGEAIKSISAEIKDAHSNIDWKPIKAMRNYLVHEYYRVDLGELWSSYVIDLPGFLEQIQDLIIYLEKEIEK